MPGLRQQRGLVARRRAAVIDDGRAAQRARAGALGPPARRRARSPAARRGRRRARGRARLAARAAPHLLGARAGSPPGAGRPATRSLATMLRRRRRRALAAADGAWRLDWPAADPRRIRFAVAVDAFALLADAARLARVRRCPGPPLRLAVPRHQRPAPLVLDDDVRQPGQDAPPLRAPARRRSPPVACRPDEGRAAGPVRAPAAHPPSMPWPRGASARRVTWRRSAYYRRCRAAPRHRGGRPARARSTASRSPAGLRARTPRPTGRSGPPRAAGRPERR